MCWGVGPQGVLKEDVSRYLLQMRIKLVFQPFYPTAFILFSYCFSGVGLVCPDECFFCLIPSSFFSNLYGKLIISVMKAMSSFA